jgi:lipid II:glycine glycyltransferase (peptidoglycan interpeptide bridge formation enzyme)
MIIREITSKTDWEDFLSMVKPHSFLTSWDWGEVQERLGTKIFRFGIFNEDSLVGVVLVLLIKARRGSFLFCPHGPIIKSGVTTESVLTALLTILRGLGRKLKCSFIRLSPLLDNSEGNRTLFRQLGFHNAPIHLMHPELAWLLDIRKDEETLLRNMRKTTRYLIRRAEKEGIGVREGDSNFNLEEFLKIYQTTVDRQNFTPFRDEFLKNELEVFKKDNHIKIFLAEYEGRAIAAAVIVFYGRSAFYHHGASDQTLSQIPGSYLLQWRAIQAAKARGCDFYNFWGIVRGGNKKHPWAGLSLFKTGFGGFEEEYLHAQDFILSPQYYFVYLVEKLRRMRRNL